MVRTNKKIPYALFALGITVGLAASLVANWIFAFSAIWVKHVLGLAGLVALIFAMYLMFKVLK